ncbi:MAG TPA: TPM domain-containing protein [Ramlibacter sp.]|nr:TPM domain-containing protein [Ramlibacter sp.]
MAQDHKSQSLIARVLRHRWLDESDTRKAIPPDLLERLARRVAASERRHTGEVRIYAEAGLPLSYLWRRASPRERAIAMFGKLGVWDTEHNNGVLIYLLLAEHAIEIVADRGLSQRVAAGEWEAIVKRMGAALHEGRFEDGITQALEEVSALLVAHFPAGTGQANPNELPDEPVLG